MELRIPSFPIHIGLAAFVAGIFLSNSILQMAAGVLLLLWLIELSTGHRPARWESASVFLSAFFLSGLLALLLSPDPGFSFSKIIRYLIPLTAIPIAHWSRGAPPTVMRRYGRWMVALGTLAAGAGIWHHWQGEWRASGFYGGPYTLASALAFSMPIGIGLWLSSRGWPRLLIGIALIGQFAGLCTTVTRGAVLGLILALLVGSIVWYRRGNIPHTRWVLFPIWGGLVLLFIGFGLLSPDGRINPFLYSELAEQNIVVDVSSGRIKLPGEALELQRRSFRTRAGWRLLVGHGLNSRSLNFQDNYGSWESDYLEALMDQGIPGLALLVGLYGLFLRRLGLVLFSGKISLDAFTLGVGMSALAFWVQSFFTLQLLSMNSSAHFALLLPLLEWCLRRQGIEVKPVSET